jgi:hypothetical protein
MSHENIELRNCNDAPVFPENTWALKGDAQTYGFIANTTTAVPLSATEMGGTPTSGIGATIHQGTNIPAVGSQEAITINPGVDNAQFAQTSGGSDAQIIVTQPNGTTQIKTSIPPVFITVDDLNISGAQTRGSSNKFFTHFSYTWIDREDWIPYFGIGSEIEFGNTGDNNDSNSNCNNGISCALSKWAVLVKGGVSFD